MHLNLKLESWHFQVVELVLVVFQSSSRNFKFTTTYLCTGGLTLGGLFAHRFGATGLFVVRGLLLRLGVGGGRRLLLVVARAASLEALGKFLGRGDGQAAGGAEARVPERDGGGGRDEARRGGAVGGGARGGELDARDGEERAEDGRGERADGCLLYTSPSPRDKRQSRMPSSA